MAPPRLWPCQVKHCAEGVRASEGGGRIEKRTLLGVEADEIVDPRVVARGHDTPHLWGRGLRRLDAEMGRGEVGGGKVLKFGDAEEKAKG